MKKVILILLTVATIVACNQKPEGYSIAGDLRGEVENGTQVFLRKQGENNQPVGVDTTTVENGKFTFNGVANTPEMHYLFVDKTQGYSGIILENGDIEVSAQKDSIGFAKITGTPQNDMFSDYLKRRREMAEKGIAIQEDMQTATNSKDAVGLGALKEEMMEFQEEYKNFELDFIKENPSALISVLLLDKAIASRVLPSEDVQGVYDALSPEIKETKAAKKIFEQLDAIKEKVEKAKATKIGVKAPEFTAPGVNGEQLALTDMLGKVTLVDFWAAWCKPCRAENPNVVAVYKKYHDKGLNVVGVSLDRTAEAWKKAIIEDELTWNHVSHVKYFNDPIARLYNVDAIPAAFLLDENGIIVAKNLRGFALEAKVAELLD